MRRAGVGVTIALGCVCALFVALCWADWFETRVVAVVPGRVLRGAWQRPGPLDRLIKREGIRTIVTLTAINEDDPKYVAQERVVRLHGIEWIIIPMRGSTATLEQMARAADLIDDPARQPVFFHCVGGHHRSNLVHAAYRIRHERRSAESAWRELTRLAWTRPNNPRDQTDRRLIEAFAQYCAREWASSPRPMAGL